MRFRKRANVTVEAQRLQHSMELVDEDGNRKRGRKGDYLVTGVLDRQYIVEKEVFEATYEPDTEADR